jgi:hypothetical protein
MKRLFAICILMTGTAAWAQTTRPAQSADDVLNRLLQPVRPIAQPLQSEPEAPRKDTATAKAIAPGVQQMNLIREGTYLVDRVGRLTRLADGQNELTLEADGRSMKDPPMLILPNLKLQDMEMIVRQRSRDLRFRVTGELTEYNGRNYILLHKWVEVPDQLVPVIKRDENTVDRNRR